jgi:hypothetical protein
LINAKTLSTFILILTAVPLLFAQEPLLGDIPDGTRSKSVHLIKLIDEDSSTVRLSDQPMMPFSPKNTCGKCHDYNQISHGWHFNAADSGIDSGRPGQPWIYVDQQSSTQIPLSYREWKGTYKPERLGFTALKFVETFGRQMPGGGAGEDTTLRSLDNLFRWEISGDLEVNCLSCHDAEFAHNQAAYAPQTAKQNFRWAATATSAFAWIEGSAKDMSVQYDLYAGSAPANIDKAPPRVIYDPSRFNSKNEVYFDITKNIPNENCYFCHSTKIIKTEKFDIAYSENDVHLLSGMHCVDCHQNGLDHQMVRGYSGEPLKEDIHLESLTCEGCHLGNQNESEAPFGGIAGAPVPEHAGIPTIHFESMTCTACHSGPWPSAETGTVKTSMAHALGVHGSVKSDEMLPHILSPVLMTGHDGKIAPHNLIWPSFWAEVSGDTISPLAIDDIRPITEALLVNHDTLHTGQWLSLSGDSVMKVIDSLEIAFGSEKNFAFISGGYIYQKSDKNLITKKEHTVAEPYVWAIAHDVRPARQSLGVRGCNDCHSTSSPFYYSKIDMDSPLNLNTAAMVKMIDFQESNQVGAWIFSFSFLFRPWLKFIVIFSVIIIIAILILYAFKGLSIITTTVSSEQ